MSAALKSYVPALWRIAADRMAVACAAVAGVALAASPALALDLSQPVALVQTASTSFQVPVAPWNGQQVDVVQADGALQQQAFRIAGDDGTRALMDSMRAELTGQGFEVIFECDTQACGGFDFRFAVTVLPEPDMHVDLGDFRYLSAQRGDDYATVMVSRSAAAGFIQLSQVTAGAAPVVQIVTATKNSEPEELGALLESDGYALLDGVEFASGSDELQPGGEIVLSQLADYMLRNPDKSVTLVGHTDAVGALAGNVALSRKRALSVRARLIRDFGVPEIQLAADGVGYLAPRFSNLQDQSRAKNRRVEAILTSTR
jgi:outer membrane protein OmpA-like peptidoglycan-associated protein